MTLLMHVSHSFNTGVVKGKDSRTFLNRLCTLDFKKHPPHHQALSFLLNAKKISNGSFPEAETSAQFLFQNSPLPT